MKRWPTVALIYACTARGWSATLNGAITWWGWDISTLSWESFSLQRPPSQNRYNRSKLFRVFASLLLGIASHAMSIIIAVLSCQFFFAIQTNWNSKWIAFCCMQYEAVGDLFHRAVFFIFLFGMSMCVRGNSAFGLKISVTVIKHGSMQCIHHIKSTPPVVLWTSVNR